MEIRTALQILHCVSENRSLCCSIILFTAHKQRDKERSHPPIIKHNVKNTTTKGFKLPLKTRMKPFQDDFTTNNLRKSQHSGLSKNPTWWIVKSSLQTVPKNPVSHHSDLKLNRLLDQCLIPRTPRVIVLLSSSSLRVKLTDECLF